MHHKAFHISMSVDVFLFFLNESLSPKLKGLVKCVNEEFSFITLSKLAYNNRNIFIDIWPSSFFESLNQIYRVQLTCSAFFPQVTWSGLNRGRRRTPCSNYRRGSSKRNRWRPTVRRPAARRSTGAPLATRWKKWRSWRTAKSRSTRPSTKRMPECRRFRRRPASGAWA